MKPDVTSASSAGGGSEPSPAHSPRDTHGRPLNSLRLSVTDRCNLRCSYCMPEEEYTWLPKRDVLSFEEIERVVRVFADLGVTKLRLTGGEPLLRRDLPLLIEKLARIDGIDDLALTTNGILLTEQAPALLAAGLGRLTVSLDSLDPERFRELARRDDLHRVLAGIDAAREAGFEQIKLDTVVLRGANDQELDALIDYARSIDGEVRFIEYMDVGGATHWSPERVFSRDAILERLGGQNDAIEAVTPESEEAERAPATRYVLPDGTVFGIIASTTAPFCRSCDRSRLTADGHWYMCLYAPDGIDLRTPLRSGATDRELADRIRGTWSRRTDRGAEERLAVRGRTPLASPEALRANPHLEMHTRGG